MECYTFGTSHSTIRYLLLVYDITDDKRRRKFSKLLEGYGQRVQESAFEFALSNQKYNKFMSLISGFITSDDNVRTYLFHNYSEVISWTGQTNQINCNVMICQH